MAKPQASGSDGVPGLLDALAQVSFLMMGMLTQLAAEQDLSLTQLRALAILRDRQPRMAELATALGLDRSTITGLISRAEQRGLLHRVPAIRDGRAVEVALTAEGRRLAEHGTNRMSAYVGELSRHLSNQERDQLTKLLSSLLTPPTTS